MPKRKVVRRRGKQTVDKKQDRKIRQLMVMAKPEYKVFTGASSANTLPLQSSNAMILVNMCAPQQGTAGDQRVGERISLKRLKFNLHAYNTGAVNGSNWFRVIIYQDNRYTGTLLAGANLLALYNTTNLSAANILSDYADTYINDKLEKGKQINILFDKKVFFGPYSVIATTSIADNTHAHISYDKVFKKPKMINFAGANSLTGAVYLALFPGNSTASAVNPNYAYQIFSYYSDS